MELSVVWWAWIIVGSGFLLIELMSSTFFGLWMAIAALAPAVSSLIWPQMDLAWQLAVWVAAMLLCGWLWTRYNRKHHAPEDALLGQTGVLARGCSQHQQGLLLLQKPVQGATEWRCISAQPLPAASRVIITEQPEPYLVRVEKAPSLHQQKGSELCQQD